MRRRTRTLLGTIGMLTFVALYAPLAMALADSRISQTPPAVQAILLRLPRHRLDLPPDAADPLDGAKGCRWRALNPKQV